jgi:plastocyanin
MNRHVRTVALLAAIVVGSGAAHAQMSEIVAQVTDSRGKPVVDAVVVAVPADANARAGTRPREAIVDQVDKEFVPRVMAIFVGTTVTFPNHDDVRHHVYSFSAAKRFELPLYSGVPAKAVVFDKPGVVVLGCNIHDWMIGYIYVSESPYFAKTASDGKAVISDLPQRAYVVRVWHPEQDEAEDTTRKNVDVSRTAHIDVAWQLGLKPKLNVRRAPTGERGGRY